MKMTLHVSGRKKEVVPEPVEEQWFEVKPLDINKKLFRKKRKDENQEKTRKLILEAFAKVESNPEKYGRTFETMMPRRTWKKKTVEEMVEMASNRGDHIANWVEQALEWAQRIHNGESWEAVCNNADKANWSRVIIWKDGNVRYVGGARKICDTNPASEVWGNSYLLYVCNGDTYYAVPLVVRYRQQSTI